jgi:nucleoside-diphosphate-sugar epimerase
MKVLVTGAAGDIGSALIPTLLKRGYQVRGLVRKEAQAKTLQKAGVETWQGDMTDKSSLHGIAEGIQAVYHLAAVLWVPNPRVDIPKVNYCGTANVADEFAGKKIERFIFPSFPLILGPSKKLLKELLPQEAPSAPTFYHAIYKKKAEEYLLDLHAKGALPITILRLGTVYGPNTLLIRTVTGLLKLRIFAIAGSGENLIQMCHIEDVVQGMILALEKKAARGKIYNICDNKAVTMKEFIYALADRLRVRRPPTMPTSLVMAAAFASASWARVTGSQPLTNPEIVKMSVSSFVADNSRAKEELGFSPKYPTIYQGIETCF